MPQLIDKSKIYFYLSLLLILLSVHNLNIINFFNNFFKINKIELSGNIDNSLQQEVMLSLVKFYNYNIFSKNLDEIKHNLDNFEIIGEYNIKKEYPSVIKLDLKKTNILAYFFENNQRFFLGENGKKIKQNINLNDKLPLIVGEVDIQKFLNLKKILNKQGFNLNDFDKFYYFKSNRWDLIYKDKLLLKLPDRNLEFSINLFKQIIENHDINDLNVIDLRIENKIIYS